MPVQELTEVTDAPTWQAEPTETTTLMITGITEHRIPNIDNWVAPFLVLSPAFISQEDGILVLKGVHIERHWFWSMIGNYGSIDGINRWEIGIGEFQTFNFQNQSEWNWLVYGANLANNDGPEFFLNYSIWSGGEPGKGQLNKRAFVLFSENGDELVSIDDFKLHRGFSIANSLPLEYPDTDKFLWDCYCGNSHEYYIIDFSNGGRMYLDPRTGNSQLPEHVNEWIAATGEWFCSEFKEIDGVRHQDIAVVREDGSIISLNERSWPGFPKPDGEPSTMFQPQLTPFFWEGHRYLLFYCSSYGQDETEPIRWWMVRFDPDSDAAEPIWCRDEPYIIHVTEQIITMGPDDHPFWVRFGSFAGIVRVIDLLSGELVINQPVSLTPREEGDSPTSLVYRLDEDRDIPAIFIFDPNGGKLIQIDLEIGVN